ncbi:MAG: helix-turn-helix domain-containing protein [Eubacterium sp.]|nr:helix-turn-helix domain-containing protein [Eubacterium sp.]
MEIVIFWGEILRKARVAHNLTQKEIADVLHISRQAYSGIETGRTHPSPEMIAILSNIYDINLFEFMFKYLPEEYIAETHEFKYSIPSSPSISSTKSSKIRRKPKMIYPENIDDLDEE